MLKGLAKSALQFVTSRISQETHRQLLFSPVYEQFHGVNGLKPLDVRKFAQLHTAMEAGEFYCRHLYNVPYFESYLDHLHEMVARAVQLGDGAVLEFGVATGTTLRAIADTAMRPVVGFDSFKGLPDTWRDGHSVGAFAGEPPVIPANASLRIGQIETTLPDYLSSFGHDEIQFIHVDTDIYSSAKFILSACRPFMRNTIVVFDEFFNYPGWRDHEYRAFREFEALHADTLQCRYIGLGGTAAVSVAITTK